jgi:hypothetical protein
MIKAILIFLFSLSALYGATIEGHVTDATTHEYLIGANIILVNTQFGAASNLKGNFKINNLSAGKNILKISYVGYHSQDITVFIKDTSEVVHLEIKLTADTTTHSIGCPIITPSYQHIIATTPISPQIVKYKNNIIYAELLGNGLFSSVNYERVISNNFDLRLGLGFVFSNSESNSGSHHTTVFLPLAMANYLIDIYGDNYIEVGGGFLIASTDLEISDTFAQSMNVFVPTIAIGYRYSPKSGGVFFSAAFDMFILDSITPWGGLGIGYRF